MTLCVAPWKSSAPWSKRNTDVPAKPDRVPYRHHVGDIIIDEGDIFGDGVNIAAGSKASPTPAAFAFRMTLRSRSSGKLDDRLQRYGRAALKNIAGRAGLSGREPRHARGAPQRRLRRAALPDKPSIAVLPFPNMSGDPEQEYFADGMVEEIITALSRIRWLFVIARNSSFTYKGKAVDIEAGRPRTRRPLCARRQRAQGRRPRADHGSTDRGGDRRAYLGRPL